MRFVYIKHSQGTTYRDSCGEVNRAAAKQAGLKVGAYHFANMENAIKQAEFFIKCMGDFDFDLPPAIDCEMYNNVMPSEAVTDVIGMRLTDWMAARPRLAPFGYPAIYTNVGFGNQIFRSAKMSRYNLWVAHWGVEKPLLPSVWKKEKPFIWQDAMVEGARFGLPNGKLDHDVWMTKFPFPGEDAPPVEEDALIRVKRLLWEAKNSGAERVSVATGDLEDVLAAAGRQ